MTGFQASEDALDRLLDALSAQVVLEPIQLDDKIIIPVNKVALGIATMTKGTGENNKEVDVVETKEDGKVRDAADEVSGGGLGITPVAVLIISNGSSGPNGVKVVFLSPPEESLFDAAGGLMEKIGKRKKPGEKETADMAAIIIE
jgi:uncharacterized spore protein YtfJ